MKNYIIIMKKYIVFEISEDTGEYEQASIVFNDLIRAEEFFNDRIKHGKHVMLCEILKQD